jgi:hypothetical protein
LAAILVRIASMELRIFNDRKIQSDQFVVTNIEITFRSVNLKISYMLLFLTMWGNLREFAFIPFCHLDNTIVASELVIFEFADE